MAALQLPTEPLPAIPDLTGNNLLVVADYGMGKSGLLASTGYICGDPEDKLKSYPDVLRVTLTSWKDHLDFRDALAKAPGRYPGIGLDNINVSYDHATTWVMKHVKFAGNFLTHPSENPQLCYPRITHEFITWLRDMTLLKYHVVATCHCNVVEIRDKKGSLYNRWVPAFVGGSARSTYAEVLKTFSIVGFMTLEDVIKPSTRMVMGKSVADVRTDSSRIEPAETELRRVIYFRQDPNWLANNKFGGFPDSVILPTDWREDWNTLREAWGSAETHGVASEEVGPTGAPPTPPKAVGLGKK